MLNHYDWAAKWAKYSPNKIAFKEFETSRSLSFQQLNQLANRLAHRLSNECGIQKGDRIAIIAENCLEYLVLFSAAQKTGCILVPMNYRLTSTEINYLLTNSQPKIVITEAKFEEKIKGTKHYHQIPHHWKMENLSSFLDATQPQNDDKYFSPVSLKEDDPIFILFTSGSTGFPKGALYTYKMLFWNSINTAMSLIVNTDSRTVNCMPPFHTGGWNVLLTPFFHHGGFTCLMKSFDAKNILQLLEKEKATIFMGVPTMLKMMAALPEFETTDLSSLHYIIVGGEAMPVPLIEKWDKKGIAIRQGFGMTEVGPNLTSLHQDDAIRKIGSIGRPNFYVSIKIVNDKDEVCQTNEAGQLLLKGAMVTSGYWKNEEATKNAFKDGWFYTGDLVKQDEEGYLFVVDRIKNMYISGGENVYPAEVERVIMTHPLVNEVAVIGVADEKWGESGKAFIVKKTGLAEQELKDYCLIHLAKFKVPKHIEFITELPKNDTGKINRLALK